MSKVRGIFCQNSKCKHYFEDNCMKVFETDVVEISEEGKCNDFKTGMHIGYSNVSKPIYENIVVSRIVAGEMPLQQAAAIIQSEFAKKSDWYDALAASINSVLMEQSSEYLTNELADKIADRLIGE